MIKNRNIESPTFYLKKFGEKNLIYQKRDLSHNKNSNLLIFFSYIALLSSSLYTISHIM